LIDPKSSIPTGTIGAILFSTAIYIFIVWVFGLTISNATLKENKFILADIAFPHAQVVRVGVAVSCIGCSLQYMASAPRLLAAIANDNAMPILNFVNDNRNKTANGHRKDVGTSTPPTLASDEAALGDLDEREVPRRALYITLLIVSCASLTGNLDEISPLATMFFLLMYAGINCSCFLLGFTNVGFRPTFKTYHWTVSLFGFIWCIGLALSIDFPMATLSIMIFITVALYNRKKMTRRKDWGGVFDSVKYDVVKNSLRSLSHTTTSDMNAKNWRPQILTFVDMDKFGEPKNAPVLHLASQLKKGHGINIVVGVLETSDIMKDSNNAQIDNGTYRIGMDSEVVCETLSNSKRILHQQVMVEKMDGFVQVALSDRNAIWSAILHAGIGPLSPNTVLLSYPTQKHRGDQWKEDEFMKTIKGISNMKVALLLFRGTDHYQSITSVSEIHVWWIIHDGGLLLLLPYILAKNGSNNTRLRIFAVTTSTDSTENPDKLKRAVERHLQEVRILASVTIIDLSNTTIADDMRDTSLEQTMAPLFAETNTHDMTVSEAFSHESYEVPYLPLNDIEVGVQQGKPKSNDGNDNCLKEKTFMTEGTELNLNKSMEDDDDDESHTNDDERRLKNAETFNHFLRLHSSNADLVVANLPLIHKYEASSLIFKYIDVMCDGLDNVLMIRGSGKEVITTYV